MGITLGVGGGVKGYGRQQLLVGATAFGSFDEAAGAFLGMWDYKLPFAKRFFFSLQGMVGHYPRQQVYSTMTLHENEPRPGSNDSDCDQYVEKSGYDNWSDFRLEDVLPIGSARDDPLQHY